jgi:hypothetical protein
MSLFRKMIAGAAALAAGAVAACDQMPTTRVVHMRPGGIADLLRSATSHGPLVVETLGNPFAEASPQAVADVVAATVRTAVQSRIIGVVTAPEPGPPPVYRLRVALDVSPATNPRTLCGDDVAVAPPGAGDRLGVLMVFCTRDEMEAAVRGHIPRPADPAEARFGKLIGQMTRDIFAARPIGG